eukprot:2650962-Prymnesium_polylepis.1
MVFALKQQSQGPVPLSTSDRSCALAHITGIFQSDARKPSASLSPGFEASRLVEGRGRVEATSRLASRLASRL